MEPIGRSSLNDSLLPRYQCHKIVRAAKITRIAEEQVMPSWLLFFDDLPPLSPGAILQANVSLAWFQKHEPKVGGYYVLYDDGYESFSPAEAFEAGYSRLPDTP